MPGHRIYHEARNALELLEHLCVGISKEKRSRAMRLHYMKEDDEHMNFLRRAGVVLSDFKDAGFATLRLHRGIGFSPRKVFQSFDCSELFESSLQCHKYLETLEDDTYENKHKEEEAHIILNLLQNPYTKDDALASLVKRSVCAKMFEVSQMDNMSQNVRAVMLEALASDPYLSWIVLKEKRALQILFNILAAENTGMELRKGARKLFCADTENFIDPNFKEMRERFLIEKCRILIDATDEKGMLDTARAISRFADHMHVFEEDHIYGCNYFIASVISKYPIAMNAILDSLKCTTFENERSRHEYIEHCASIISCVFELYTFGCKSRYHNISTLLLEYIEGSKLDEQFLPVHCACALKIVSGILGSKIQLWKSDAPSKIMTIIRRRGILGNLSANSRGVMLNLCRTLGNLAMAPDARGLIIDLIDDVDAATSPQGHKRK